MRIAVFLFFCVTSLLSGQNLVPNPSFENIKDTISGFTESNFHFEKKIKDWTAVNTASPDLITPNFFEKYITVPAPHTGSNMIGIQSFVTFEGENHSGEYVAVKLINELVPNRTYYVEYWIRRAKCKNPFVDNNKILNPKFGILFYLDTLKTSGYKMLDYEPQIIADAPLLITNMEWVKVSKYFTPKSRYNKICLGQFWHEDEDIYILNSYYIIDDVLVEELRDFGRFDKNAKLSIGNIIPLNHINFKTGTAELSDKNSYTQLKELITYLISNPSMKIRVNGHTDSVGSKKSNLILSIKRAKCIANYIKKAGISEARIDFEGFGDSNPIGDNETEDGRSRNRRVEFEVFAN